LQVGCAPSAPTVNRKLLSMELVEQYGYLHRKCEVGSHGRLAYFYLQSLIVFL